VTRRFKVAALQFEVEPNNILGNLSTAAELVEEAASENVRLAVLPEYCWTAFADPRLAQRIPTGSIPQGICELARQHSMCIASGSIVETDEDRLYLTSLLIGPDGEILGKHRKTSLVGADVEVKLQGKSAVGMKNELGAGIHPGQSIEPIRTELGTIGLLLGAELDVPEVARTQVLKGAEILIASVSFEMRWAEDINFLGRARAYENSAYVIVANRSGDWDSPEGYLTYGGSSIIVSPLGEIISNAGQRLTKGMAAATIDFDRLTEIRRSFNMLALRQPELYTVRANAAEE
jgi:predicted amidohydrolase